MFGLSASLLNSLAAFLVLMGGLSLLGRVPIHYNLMNLRVRWKTTAMTALAFTLIIALLTVMTAFVNGMVAITEGSGQPGNVIILSEGANDESVSNLGYGDIGDIANQPGIERNESGPLVSRETYLVISQPIADPPPGRPQRRFLQLRGIDDPERSGRVHGIELLEGGNWFSPAGVRESSDGSTAIETVFGEGIACELARDRPPEVNATARNRDRLEVGDAFRLDDRDWRVVGVMKSSGSTFDSEVWAKRSLIGPMFGKETHSTLVARATNGAEGAQSLKKFLNESYSKAAINAQVETEYFASLAETSTTFLYAVVFVTIILAVGGVFGIMNTMFAAISQRTADIGVLRVLGFSRTSILMSFLLESMTLALIGGTLGCLIGALVDGTTATSIVGSGHAGGAKLVVLKLAVDINTIAAGMLLALTMGLLGGLLPSLNAMRLSPLKAIR
ncbi:MAG TPA: ABC transporter permease [Planctomicrobium sp.]|nr:ABC transporter permease [Planctomicrobium sp.]